MAGDLGGKARCMLTGTFTKSLFLLRMEVLSSISSCSPTPAQPTHCVTFLLKWSPRTVCVSFFLPSYTFKNNLAEPKVCSLSMPGTLGEVWCSSEEP